MGGGWSTDDFLQESLLSSNRKYWCLLLFSRSKGWAHEALFWLLG